uniref:Uncharacterized protein n=1 Tax=Meloidogyne enterolobii TaxID=390850 RepID=A0A6V7X569_MELEN|nr:unnamed protein product [Meloidogyne enterolobii]
MLKLLVFSSFIQQVAAGGGEATILAIGVPLIFLLAGVIIFLLCCLDVEQPSSTINPPKIELDEEKQIGNVQIYDQEINEETENNLLNDEEQNNEENNNEENNTEEVPPPIVDKKGKNII